MKAFLLTGGLGTKVLRKTELRPKATKEGTPNNSLSISDLFVWIAGMIRSPIQFRGGEVRPSDQMIFISDNALTMQLRIGMSPTFLAGDLSDLWDQG